MSFRHLLLPPLLCFVLCFASAEQSLYLKEILLGRCYFEPPEKGAAAELCPNVVGSIMNVMESHLDADITSQDFDPYLEQANFSSPTDKALLYLHFFGDDGSPLSFAPPPGFVDPENTPGGALLKDLVFCGVDQRGNCSIEKSNAYWTFWEAAYAKFASQAQGHVTMVLDSKADVQFLQRSAISNLQADKISSVTIYGSNDCESKDDGAGFVMDSLKEHGFDKVTCKNDIMELYLYNLDTTMSDDDEFAKHDSGKPETYSDQNHEHQESSKARWGAYCVRFLLLLILTVIAIFGLYTCVVGDARLSGKDQPTFVDYCKSRILCPIQDVWRQASDYFQPDHNDGTSENSPLVIDGNHDYVIDEFGRRIPATQAVPSQ